MNVAPHAFEDCFGPESKIFISMVKLEEEMNACERLSAEQSRNDRAGDGVNVNGAMPHLPGSTLELGLPSPHRLQDQISSPHPPLSFQTDTSTPTPHDPQNYPYPKPT